MIARRIDHPWPDKRIELEDVSLDDRADPRKRVRHVVGSPLLAVDQAAELLLQLPKAQLRLGDRINIKAHDLMTDEHYTWTQEWNYVEVDPYKMPFHLFKIDIHESYM